MQIDDRMVNLSPGMAVTVEIKTGSRVILSYLLSPLREQKTRLQLLTARSTAWCNNSPFTRLVALSRRRNRCS
jgi:hypothetical protein